MARSIAIVLKNNWKQAWSSSMQRAQILIGSILMIAISLMLPSFFNLIQGRSGVVLNDGLLAAIPACNVSWAIFAILWSFGLYSLWRSIETPAIYITYIWMFVFICVLRVIAISIVPLDPPKGIIMLTDPLTGIFYGESNITKDLFFSGHTSVLFMMALCLEKKWDKIAAFVATIILGILLLIQHVHYTVDVIAAPIIVYPVYRMVKYLLG